VQLQDVASCRQFNGLVPEEVDVLISGALARHPADRPHRIDALARAIEGVVVPGSWQVALAEMVVDSFFAPALRRWL